MQQRRLQPLPSATWIDETLLAEPERAVAILFGRRSDPRCAPAEKELLDAADELLLEMHTFFVDLDEVRDS